MEVGISLGSNLGDRLAFLTAARHEIAAVEGLTLTARSPAYETDPFEVSDAHADKAFLNAVLVVTATINAGAVAEALHQIEDRLGRSRTEDRNAPRPIDLDVLYVDGNRIDTESLSVPHPRWNERRFVVEPLADVRADLVLPGDDRSVSEILLSLPVEPKVVLFAEEW